jgi:hypothetical protein
MPGQINNPAFSVSEPSWIADLDEMKLKALKK